MPTPLALVGCCRATWNTRGLCQIAAASATIGLLPRGAERLGLIKLRPGRAHTHTRGSLGGRWSPRPTCRPDPEAARLLRAPGP